MNTSAYSINFCLCTHCSADPVASCWAQTFCTCLKEVWTKRWWKAGPFILLIAWTKINGPHQPDLPHITLPFGIHCTSVCVVQYHHANSCIFGRCMHLQETVLDCWCPLPLLTCQFKISLKALQCHGFSQASQSCGNTELRRSCCTCCECEGCQTLADENQSCH